MELMASLLQMGADGDCGMSNLLVPSPQSEAVTHEMEELSLQPTQSLPPLSERKNVLQLRLQQRRTREQLVDQGIMPPLKSPAAFHGQIRSLERARTENFLKHKIRSRPERAELVRMHILQETGAEPSLQATQMKLKRARLADNLNEKIAQRPGPMELVEKNILPVDSSLKQAIIGQVNYAKVLDEDSCEALSPEQPASQESQSSAPSPGENKMPETPSPGPAPAPQFIPTLQAFPTTDFTKAISSAEQPPSRPAVPPALLATTAAPPKPGPTLVKQSQQKGPSEKSRSKKGKEPKPRVKKLKYHQYVPPDQKQEASEAPMDSSYARLLQQQQLFLQLQILSQQQQHYNYQTILPAPLKPVTEGQSNSAGTLPTSIVVSLPTAPPPPPLPSAIARPNNPPSNRKPGVLPANLEEMKVPELKLELKLRGLPVSGTKTDLIERLKPFQDNLNTTTPSTIPAPDTTTLSSIPMDITTTTTPAIVLPVQQVAPENMSFTPPVSPADPSNLEQDVGMSEAPSEIQIGSFGSAGIHSSPVPSFQVPEEKDRRLHEKERQIEELMRKLEQEQRLVEELKMQLEVEKRVQGGCTADSTSVSPTLSSVPAINTVPTVLNSNVVKMEGTILSNCSSTTAAIPNSILGSQGLTAPLPTMVKLEDVTVSSAKSLQLQTQTGLITQIQPQVTTSPQLQPQSQKSPQLQSQPQPAAHSLQQFFIRHPGGVSQVLGQPQTLLTTSRQPQTLLTATSQAGTQILVPVSLPNNATAIQLPSTTVSLQSVLQATVSNPGLVQAAVPQLHTTKVEMTPNQQPLLQTLTMCNNNTGLKNQTRPKLNPQCFLKNSQENRVSPRVSPNHQISNGPLNKSSSPQPAFILQPTSLVAQPPKTKEPPRYEEAVKQSRNLHINNASQVPTATSQHMDDLFDILIESGEITPFIQQDPPASLSKTLPVTVNITTLPINTALSRPPPQIQVGPPPTLSSAVNPSLLSLTSLATDNQLEAFLEGTLADTPSASDPRTQGLMEELQAQLMDQQPYSPMDTSDLSFCDSSSPPSSLNMGLSDPTLDNMEWLDLTMPPGSAGALTPLGIPTDFLDTHDLQLHWD
ncbi:myocardin-related transcription factor B [Melanotaenia boesemani]|uniref:myocardin-related transcription factor B n=1 Tax=Melanotaenia boesemani TaxID=1250792 RepID=UPI001C05C01F|nr:myocardin-related transcription factor B [Melanotaenia boesemani]XP_041829725.1 myocardin-related transcription factor B [Melanotaenia boesemani]XP_041829726.1 myocardin-related transcription factor B [Melanotaenia boesemani]XP_041829727.1 myocardin-related transcription factor B [Melanotaenia boesemani]